LLQNQSESAIRSGTIWKIVPQFRMSTADVARLSVRQNNLKNCSAIPNYCQGELTKSSASPFTPFVSFVVKKVRCRADFRPP